MKEKQRRASYEVTKRHQQVTINLYFIVPTLWTRQMMQDAKYSCNETPWPLLEHSLI